MAKGSNSVVPENPAKTGRTDDYDTEMLVEHLTLTSTRDARFEEDANESGEAMDEDYDLEEKKDIPEDVILAAERPLTRNLMDELDEVVGPEPAFGDDDDEEEDDSDDSKQVVTMSQATEQKTGYWPPMNGDTPAANKVLDRTFEEIMEKSTWIRLFEPKRIRQAVWADISHVLAVASDSHDDWTSLQAQATPTQAVLESWIPAEAGADLWKWRRKLRVGFGVTDIHYSQPPVGKTSGGGVDPSKIPLPKTHSKGYNTGPKSHDVFSKSGDETPYFQDSHMITPMSSGKEEQSDRDSGRANATRSTIRVPKENVGRKIELATDRPLRQIRAFSGLRNKSENSMQWLRGFVYEMKGTRASPDKWCMPFQLSWKDGALHWHRQLPKKTKRTWSLLSSSFIRYYCAQYNPTAETRYYSAKREDKEHLCDYLNRLNGYARNAGNTIRQGRPKGTRSREAFPGNLWRSRTRMEVYDIHELEAVIIKILKVDDR
ncbi:LOW QUALITY PROTEIN: Eukaryotic/viral aspartic protease [Phytophthora megakarya]|uniref:Eukaryotic/viral aspartic protease n=1 Tax=Phytophthora megakarya TaxID=4795 RepID=A0A225WFX3_9STRA|nr:LOW QUALITY PROTEIN: Eukaryotic/viral aspartic protease [Phytophthora megakarya]